MSEPSPPGPRGKPATRRSILSRRDALTAAERDARSAAIAERVGGLLDQHRPGVLAMYAAKGSEVATWAMDAAARARGIRVVYPRVVRAQMRLVFSEVTPAELEVRRFAIPEPREDAPTIELSAIDGFLVPGIAFDRKTGARLGWGRGYYDATLAVVPQALRVGLAFETQIADIEHEPHDVAMNLIVTEVATYVVA